MMKFDVERLKVIDRDTMKFIAIIFMAAGHAVAWLNTLNGSYALTYPLKLLCELSLLCPPIMFLSVSDGYVYTRDRKKYAVRLLIFALITQIPHWMIFARGGDWRTANVIFTLFLGLLAIFVWESDRKLWLRIFFIVLIDLATVLIMSDWMIFGVLLILFLHIYRDRPRARLAAYTIICFVHQMIQPALCLFAPKLLLDAAIYFAVLMFSYLCMTTFCSGRKGRFPVFSKWFFYIFYPLHYFIIIGIYYLIK